MSPMSKQTTGASDAGALPDEAELSRRFEEFDVDSAREVPVAEYLLQRASKNRERTELQVADAVHAARAAGTSWAKIGSLIGSTGETAKRRYGNLAA